MPRKAKAPAAPETPAAAVSQPQVMSIEQAIALAYQHWNAGQTAQAEQLCQQVLHVWPEHGDALHLLGLLAHTQGNLSLAIDYVQRACAAPSAPALFYSNLTEMLRGSGRLAEAEKAGRRAVALDSQLITGWSNLGIVLQEAGKLDESLVCLRRVIERVPDSPENHNNLGNTLARLGRLQEARREYKAAIGLKPSYSVAHSNLAKLLNDLGETGPAMAEARQAIEIEPRNLDAYINIAAICLARSDPDEALRWLDNLASVAPNHPGGLVSRARILKDGDRPGEALEAARQAVAVAPQSGEAHEMLAQCLARHDQSEEALASYDRAIALPSPRPEDKLVGKGSLLVELGHTEQARALFDQALKINPGTAGAWFNRSELERFDAAEIARMEGLLAATEIHDDRIMLEFALAKGWRDVGDDERGFAHLAEGNRLKRASFEYDAAATDHWISSIIETFTEAMRDRFAGLGDPSPVPVFIIGMPRSGTTLVEQILSSHPLVHGAGELKTLQGMVDHISGPDMRPIGYPKLLDSLLDTDLPRLGRYYVGHVASLGPASARIIDKMPANFLYAGLINLLLPNARIIHCRRDPVDTCFSCYTKLFQGEQRFAYDLAELGRFHCGHDRLMAHWRTLLPADRLTDVAYEDVVNDLDGEARRLVAFLGLEWNDACLEFWKNRRPVHTASVNQVRQPIYRSSVGRWKALAGHLQPLLDSLAGEVKK
ncbi:sulfotransferase [Telmatospirillum sp.]|uniref:sulfotransferase n=1 Tax=Telmatospirillum sp. TaxID=2079197 RepID=UPI00283B87D1|nr:sulfotransferase [Telmatospirillum sp.]MDR3435504.1 sulfotransferase [Telmatospirillum sp.]